MAKSEALKYLLLDTLNRNKKFTTKENFYEIANSLEVKITKEVYEITYLLNKEKKKINEKLSKFNFYERGDISQKKNERYLKTNNSNAKLIIENILSKKIPIKKNINKIFLFSNLELIFFQMIILLKLIFNFDPLYFQLFIFLSYVLIENNFEVSKSYIILTLAPIIYLYNNNLTLLFIIFKIFQSISDTNDSKYFVRIFLYFIFLTLINYQNLSYENSTLISFALSVIFSILVIPYCKEDRFWVILIIFSFGIIIKDNYVFFILFLFLIYVYVLYFSKYVERVSTFLINK